MSKTTFEFDDGEDRDVLLIVNRHKLASALYELSDFYRSLYNGKLYTDELINVKDNRVMTEEDYKKAQDEGQPYVSGTKEYISTDYVERELDRILEDVRGLIDY